MNKLPKAYIVECKSEIETTIVATFIKGRPFKDDSRYVIFHNGLLGKNPKDSNINNSIPEQVKHLPLLTFKEWEHLKNSKEFELPKKWYIECTKANREVLNKWRLERATEYTDDEDFVVGEILLSKNIDDESFYFSSSLRVFKINSNYSLYKKITIKQFKEYVLGEQKEIVVAQEETEKEFVLPKKWFVLYNTREEFDVINDHFKKNWTYRNTVNLNGYVNHHNVSSYNNWVTNYTSECSKGSLLKQGYNQLSFAEFQKHIVNKTTQIKQDKMRTITSPQAQTIITIACDTWKPKLAKVWAEQIVLGKTIEISENFYQEMRTACTSSQNKEFDKIFGKDVTIKKGDWVITTVDTDATFKYNKKNMVFQVVKVVQNKIYYAPDECVSLDKIKPITLSERKNLAKRKMIDVASEYGFVPFNIGI